MYQEGSFMYYMICPQLDFFLFSKRTKTRKSFDFGKAFFCSSFCKAKRKKKNKFSKKNDLLFKLKKNGYRDFLDNKSTL